MSDTSEIAYDISPQPPDTCPFINDVIKGIEECEKAMRRRDRHSDEPTVLMEMLDNAESSLWGLESKLEEIRKNVIKIRQWGQEWKDLAKNNIPEPTHEHN